MRHSDVPALIGLCLAIFVFSSSTSSWVAAYGEEPSGPSPDSASAASFDDTLQPFLKTYCLDCHGSDNQEADRRFDTLSATIDDDQTLVDYQDIVDQLNLGQMPPEDAIKVYKTE